MADFEEDQHEELSINSEKISDDITGIVKGKLAVEKWNGKKVDLWVKDIIEISLKYLSEMKKPFKFVVTCVIMQRNGGGLSTGFIGLWDNTKDGVVNVPWDNETMHVITTVYFLKLD
jgi:dynein light chain Tctex-type 1